MTRRWEEREHRILFAVAEAEESDERVYLSTAIGERLGLAQKQADIAFRALEQAGYLTAGPRRLSGGVLVNPYLTERGRRYVGQWPDEDPIRDLVNAIERLITETDEPDDRSRLERIRDELVGVSRDVATGVATAWATSILGPRP